MILLPALYGALLLMAFLGWGELFAIASGETTLLPAGILTFLGASVVIFFGGILNLFHALGLASTLALVAIGFAASLRWPKRLPDAVKRLVRDFRAEPLATAALVAAWLAILVLYLSYCRGWWFNSADDYFGYLAWPEKILQTGWIGDDPFSQRRFAGLGANSFLQSIVLRFFPLPNITVVEPGVAFLMIALFTQERMLGARRIAWAALSLAFMAACFTIAPRANTSSLILPIGYVMVLIVVCCEIAVEPLTWAAAARIALLATPLVSLKVNVGAFAPLGLTAFFVMRAISSRNIFREGLRAVALYLVLVLPWLLSAHATMGSWYYPLLGKSNFVTSYHDVDGLLHVQTGPMNFYYAFASCLIYPGFLAATILLIGSIIAAASGRTQKFWLFWLALGYGLIYFVLEKHRVIFVGWVLVSLGFGAVLAWRNRGRLTAREGAWGAILVGAFLALFGFYMMLNGGLYMRYFFSIAYGCFFAGFPLAVMCGARHRGSSAVYAFAVGLFAFGFATYDINFDSTLKTSLTNPRSIGALFGAHLHNVFYGPDSAEARVPQEPGNPWIFGQLQAAAPPGRVILARTRFNYAFDFSRNPIWIADEAGEISLPPGMPYKRGPEEFASYLQRLNICYIAYAYGPPSFINAERDFLSDKAGLKTAYAVTQAEVRLARDFQENVEALTKKFPVLYTDSENFLLKLCD